MLADTLAEKKNTCVIELKEYRCISEVDEALWDSILPAHEPFHAYRFIRASAEARVEDSTCWFLLFFCGGRLIATAVLAAFSVSLDIFTGNNKFIRYIKKQLPDLFRIKILSCGLPVSLGQKNIIITEKKYYAPVLRQLSEKMDELCRQHHITFQVLKEFRESSRPDMDYLLGQGFFRAYSIPYMKLPVTWTSFEAYLDSLKHGFRRQVLRSLKKMGKTLPDIQPTVYSGTEGAEKPQLLLLAKDACPPEFFHHLYLKVMERADVKLETLNAAFFKNLYSALDEKLKLLAFVNMNTIEAVALLIEQGEELTFALLGKEKERDDTCDAYFNLLYGMIALAIKGGFKTLHLGQTSYWVKQRTGAVAEQEYIYFKSRHRLLHFLLNKCKPLVFPKTVLPEVYPFKK